MATVTVDFAQKHGDLDIDRALIEVRERAHLAAKRLVQAQEAWDRAKRDREEATKLLNAVELVASRKHECVPEPRDP